MSFITGYLLGKEMDRSHFGGGLIAGMIFGIILYKQLESYLVDNFANYLLEMFVSVLFLTILIFRYSNNKYNVPMSRAYIDIILNIINYPLCIILSIVFFNVIGYTPFSFLIDEWNVLSWNYNTLTECLGEIIWVVFKVLHIVTTIGSVLFIQKLIFSYQNK